MTSTTRIQRKYDYRLRELVRSTGDAEYTIQRGAPRSTARGWLTSTRAEVVTVDIVDMDTLRLQQEVLRLQNRVDDVALEASGVPTHPEYCNRKTSLALRSRLLAQGNPTRR